METPASILDEAQSIETWSRERDSETLQAFVTRRLAHPALSDVELEVNV